MATRQTSGTRAKDSDRTDTCRILDGALLEGQLSAEEHRERVSAATQALTLGELHALVGDLQTESAAVQLPVLAKRARFGVPGVAAAALVVAVLLGIGIGWGLYGNTSSPLNFTTDPGAKPDGVAPVVLTPPRQLHSLGGLTGLLEQTRKKFGDTLGFRLVIYPDYALLDRPDPGDDRRQVSWAYRGGWSHQSSSPKSADAVLVDVGAFDPKTTVGILRGGPETLGMKPADVRSTYLVVEPERDPTTPGAITVQAYISSDYGSGYIQFAGDGTIERINYPS